MSNSYRKPYAAVCGTGSAASDKEAAARGVRRKQNAWLHNHWDDEDLLLPHKLECPHNNNYDWGRDGSQYYQGRDANDRTRYQEAVQGLGIWANDEAYTVWPPRWYQRIIRK